MKTQTLILIISGTLLFAGGFTLSLFNEAKEKQNQENNLILTQKSKDELKENIVDFSVGMVKSQVHYINSRDEIIKLLKVIEQNQWSDMVVKHSLKSTDLSVISEEAKKAMGSFNESLDYLIKIGPVSEEFNDILFRYKKILNNNYLFALGIDEGDIYSSNLQEWVSNVKEADILIERISLEMKKIVDKVK